MIKFVKICAMLLVAFLYFAPANCYANATDGTEDKQCTQERLDDMYKINKDGTIKADGCWYCNVVVIMTATYLSAAEKSLPIAQKLGTVILTWGYVIWLAIYILDKVSSLAPVKAGEMLNNILLMSFKVGLCAALVKSNVLASLLGTYLLKPIMSFGVDVGSALLDNLIS